MPAGIIFGEFGNQGFSDDVNRGWLAEQEVREAQRLELDYVHRHSIYEKVPLTTCLEETGKDPTPLRWVDTRKSSGIARSRLVVREIKKRTG